MRPFWIMPALALLAACGGGGQADDAPANGAADNGLSSANMAVENAVPPQDADNANNAGNTISAADRTELPPAMIGRWGLVPDDCTSTRGDAKGLIVISPTQVKFYESVAKLDNITEYMPQRVLADFSFSGEGMTWKRGMILDVQDAGQTLIRRETGPEASPGPFRYTRCAA